MEPVDPELTELTELTERLDAAADGVAATPDLDAVLAGAGRHRRRQRTLSLGGAAAVVALGVGGVVLVANRDTGELPAAQPEPVVVPLTTMPPADADAPADTTANDELTPATTYLLGEVEVTLDGTRDGSISTYQYDPDAPDPAEPYLEQTTEIYRRTTPSGTDVQIRRSNVSYGDLFDIEWNLPTGSQDACLGGDAVFIGSPDGPVQWLSTWSVRQWRPLDPAQEISIDEYSTEAASNLIVRTTLPVQEIAVTQGIEVTDRADFVDGVAVVEILPFGKEQFEGDETGTLLTVRVDGESEPRTFPVYGEYYGQYYGDQQGQRDCAPPPFPGQELPEPGSEQPADPDAAEAAVRERHALLVDRSDAEKPDDLLTDDTGVAEARAQMEAGGYAESAAEAEYTIDGVVFTDADTAWFQYTIVAPTGTFGPRFGQAIHNGEVWQITRTTICQDLSLASGYCDPGGSTPALTPPIAGGVDLDEAMLAWEIEQNAFYELLNCNPLNPCGQFDTAGQLPDPGEQPADADADRREVIALMESMYGAGALLERLDRIDDPTGVEAALAELSEQVDAEVGSAVADVEEVVFTSPDSAAFRYTIQTESFRFDRRVGEAVRIDGVWKITRATICGDFSLGAVTCDG